MKLASRLPKIKLLCRLSWGLTVILVLTAWPSYSASADLFQDPAFADPTDTLEMPEDWVSTPIRHPDHFDADLYAILSFQMADKWDPWIREFAREKRIDIHVDTGADGASAGALSRKEVDIASYCGSPDKTDRMPGIDFHTIGVVPVAFYVNPSSRIDHLSLEQVMKIFRGDIVNWVEVGGETMNIIPVARSHCKKRRGRWRPLNNMDDLSPGAIKVGSIKDALEYVAATPGSIGYEILTRVHPYVMEGKVKVIALDGRDPYDLSHMRKGTYPMYRAYHFSTWRGPGLKNPLAIDLVTMLKQKTEKYAMDIFFVPISRLREAGWRFHKSELIGEPEN